VEYPDGRRWILHLEFERETRKIMPIHEKQQSTQKEVELKTSQENEDSGFTLEWVELTDEMLDKKIQELESKYHLDSKTFFKLYQEGKAPDWIDDRILWGSLYKLKRAKDDVE
jgi:hypothetical protein